MIKRRFKPTLAIGSLIVVAMILSNCDDSANTPPAQVTQTAPPAPTPTNAAQTVKREPGPHYGLSGLENSWPNLEGAASGFDSTLQRENYYLVFDGSGSMKETNCSGDQPKLNVAKQAVADFVRQIPPTANLGLFIFDKVGWGERVKIGPNNHSAVIDAVNGVVAGAGTPLQAALAQAYSSLTQQGQRQLGYGQFNVVVVTDGRASKGQDPAPVVDKLLANSPIVLHTIGFCISGNHSLNQQQRAFYRQAGDAKALAQGLQDVLAEEPDFQVTAFDNKN